VRSNRERADPIPTRGPPSEAGRSSSLATAAELIRLAVAIARRVVRRELTLDPDAIAGLVKAALEQLAVHEVIRVRVHPEHEADVRTCLAGAGRAGDVEVTGDAALERGSAVFETVRGSLDASAETQLAEIERGLTDRLRSPR
jgi:flagellar assembly protein FliH